MLNGIYYEAELPQSNYSEFDFAYPQNNNFVLSYYQPTWTDYLDFIPVIAVNSIDCTIKFTNAFIQDLINSSLQQYRLSCNLGWLEQQSASSHLVIKGRNLDNIDEYPVGAGAIHVLNDDSAQEYYVTPSTTGMAEIKEHINQLQQLIDTMQYSLLNAGDNSSGESLKFRIAVKCSDLVNLVKNVGNGITLALEYVDEIMNGGSNKDIIDYLPYIDFDKINTYIGDAEQKKDDFDINIENGNVSQEELE